MSLGMTKLLLMILVAIAAISIISSLLDGRTNWDRLGFVVVDRVSQTGRYWLAISAQIVSFVFLVWMLFLKY
jgi:hypothetical protein